jgi:methyl-accepting chemotaxis protein
MAASTQRVADGGRNMAVVLDEVGAATRRTSDDLAGIRAAAAELAETSARLRNAVDMG